MTALPLLTYSSASPWRLHHIHLLANKTGYLPDLNAHYRSLSHSRPDLATVVYYETRLTSALLVVPPSSADPGITDVDPIPLDKDHKTICKTSMIPTISSTLASSIASGGS